MVSEKKKSSREKLGGDDGIVQNHVERIQWTASGRRRKKKNHEAPNGVGQKGQQSGGKRSGDGLSTLRCGLTYLGGGRRGEKKI